ncbi:MAG: response regulator [Patescibacteria group bacterium]
MVTNPYVLVVEDDPFYSKVYRTKLEKENISAIVVSNGNDALAQAKKEKPGLMLLDLILPGKDGFGILADFKADPDLKDIKVIILSNLSQEEDVKRIMALGAAEYLVKSNVSIQDVVSKVKAHLGL